MDQHPINDGSDNAFLIQSSENEEIVPSSEGEGLDWLDKNELAIKKFLIAILYFDENINHEELVNHLNELRRLSTENSRILYSFITNFIYTLEIEKYDIFINKLRNFTLNFDKADNNFEILLRIYDHCHLATQQKEYYLKVTRNFSEMDSKIQNNIKNIHKNNVTILGIFTSIVATFFGLSTFSASILNNIVDANFYKLIIIGSLIGIFFYGTIHMFNSFILKITEKNVSQEDNSKPAWYKKIPFVPIALLSIIFIIFILILCGVSDPFPDCYY